MIVLCFVNFWFRHAFGLFPCQAMALFVLLILPEKKSIRKEKYLGLTFSVSGKFGHGKQKLIEKGKRAWVAIQSLLGKSVHKILINTQISLIM